MSARTSMNLDDQVLALIAEFGEKQFFASIGRVVAAKSVVAPASVGIDWDPEEGWINVSDEVIRDWESRFQGVDVRKELAGMHTWLLTNPRNRKRRYRRFVESWLSRALKSSRAYNGGFKSSGPEPDRGF